MVFGVGWEWLPPATSLRVASAGPAYLASLTRSGEGRAGGPPREGGMDYHATFLRVTLSLKQQLQISLDDEVLWWCNYFEEFG